jgi:methionine-rich copper-binding protein CopC
VINLEPSYKGALTAILIVLAMAWMTTPAEAHETVVINVDNANGVLIEVCKQLTLNAVVLDDIDSDDAQVFYDACIAYTAEQMYAQPYKHDHS